MVGNYRWQSFTSIITRTTDSGQFDTVKGNKVVGQHLSELKFKLIVTLELADYIHLYLIVYILK